MLFFSVTTEVNESCTSSWNLFKHWNFFTGLTNRDSRFLVYSKIAFALNKITL